VMRSDNLLPEHRVFLDYISYRYWYRIVVVDVCIHTYVHMIDTYYFNFIRVHRVKVRYQEFQVPTTMTPLVAMDSDDAYQDRFCCFDTSLRRPMCSQASLVQ
jgi:hypothetical protein